MPQDQKTKHAYEHTAKAEQQEREEAKREDALNDAVLRSDQHTGQQNVLPREEENDTLRAADIKQVYDLLPDWHKDEIKRLRLMPPGTRLNLGDIFIDLRNPAAGELVAHGEETVGEELLVPKHDTDFEIWNKLKAQR